MFTWRVEDPRGRNNFSLGLQAEISVHVVKVPSRKGIYKDGGQQKRNMQFWALYWRQ